MADTPINFPPYAIVYSPTAKKTRNDLPPETMLAVLDVIDALMENPDAFPNWTSPISRDGRVRVYTHPNQAFQITYEVDEKEHRLYLLHFVAPKVQVTKSVFISYSHKDSAWLAKVKMFLKPLEDQGLLQVWDDTNISPGSEWLEEIKRSLESAQVAVFLITQNFLTSQFIGQKEFPVLLDKAKNRGCLIFWIAVSSSTVGDSELSRFQAANDPNKPLDTLPESAQATVLTEIYNRMKKAIQETSYR
jgi:TIR domain